MVQARQTVDITDITLSASQEELRWVHEGLTVYPLVI